MPVFVPGENPYLLPTASDTVLGGVKIGSGVTVTPDGTISVVDDDTGGGGGSGGSGLAPAIATYMIDAGTTVADSTAYVYNWTGAIYDQGTSTPQWDSGVDSTVLTVQEDGVYQFDAQFHIRAGSGGQIDTVIEMLGGPASPIAYNYGQIAQEILVPPTGTGHYGTLMQCSLAAQMKMNAGDTVRLIIVNYTGADLTVYGEYDPEDGDGFRSPYLAMARIDKTASVAATAAINLLIDGAGSPIATGSVGSLVIPYDCALTSVTLLADTSTSTVLDIAQETYSSYPSSTSIVASAPPTIIAAQKSQDTTLVGWTTALVAGTILHFSVTSNDNATRLTVTLAASRT